MSDSPLLLAIDQGTTSSRAIVFDLEGSAVARAQTEFAQHYPAPGRVEHDPRDLLGSVLDTARRALRDAGRPVAALGITNQRETTVLWDRRTGEPLANAIVWQDRRTAARCERLREHGHEPLVTERTGLLLDPYFSATKLAWLLDHVAGARERAARGELAFGTVDSYLIWHLTGGGVHATDATNAARTLLFDIRAQRWDEELLALFQIPRALLPEVRDSAGDFGITAEGVLPDRVPIRGVAGDQQAATVGQACFQPGQVKSTYGTGCFVVLNTGDRPVASQNRLLTTLAYRLDGKPTYALEGSIFIAGAGVQWLRDALGIIRGAEETEALAASLTGNDGVYLVPAFTGLGAPYWRPDARGALIGLTRDSGRAHLARAALESVCYQTHDLVAAMGRDLGQPITSLRVDGGMCANDWLMQTLADIVAVEVERPANTETTALGAAYLAGLGCRTFESLPSITAGWRREARFAPSLADTDRNALILGWERAVRQTLAD